MPNILTVFGASGNQGGSVIRSVLADPELSKSFKIRAVTRDTTKPNIKALQEQGVEVVSVSDLLHIPNNEIHRLGRQTDS